MMDFCDRLRHNILEVAEWGRRPPIKDENRAPNLNTAAGDEAMAGRREDVDLQLVVQDPKCARQYIAHFDWGIPDPPTYVVYGIEDKIFFNNMTDEQAVLAAQIILRDVEIPMAWRTRQMEKWEH